MPNIERLPSGTYRIAYRHGGRHRKSRTFATKRDAMAELRAITVRLDAEHRRPRSSAIPWEELVERYILTHPGRTTDHLATFRTLAERIATRFGWRTAGDATPDQTGTLTIKHARTVRTLLRYAERNLGQQIQPGAIGNCHTPSPRRDPVDLLTDERMAEIQTQADQWHAADGAIVHLIATYGHRAQSLIRLTTADVDLNAGTITLVIKSGDRHRHPLLPETIERLRPLVRPYERPMPVFIGHLRRQWKSGGEFASWLNHSMGVGVLDLRRRAITHLLDAATGDARTVASITGHRTPSLLLNVYSRTSEDRQRRILASISSKTGAQSAPMPST